MKKSTIITALFFMVQGILIPAIILAVEPEISIAKTGDLQSLLQIIEKQQQRLDEQAAQLAEQQSELKKLHSVVQELKSSQVSIAGGAPATVTGDTNTPTKKAPSRKTAGAAEKDEWPGFYSVPGTNTHFKLGGFVQLDAIRDNHDVKTPSAFVTSAIPTRRDGVEKVENGKTSFSVQASRLSVETRTPIQNSIDGDPRRVTTFFSFDLFNDFLSTTPEFRLREVYGGVDNFMSLGGDLLLGQTWSTYTNLYAVPDTLEFQGPNSLFGTRHPMIRWTRPFGDGFKLKMALEAPDLRNFEEYDHSFDSSIPGVSISDESRWPDGVFALHYEGDRCHLSSAFLARDLRASNDFTDNSDSAFAWAATLQGRVGMPEPLKDDYFQYSIVYGEGIGGVLNDVPPDAVYDVEKNKLEPLSTLGWFVAYHRQWSKQFYSLATYSELEQDNENVQVPTAFHKTQYTSANLVWNPDPRWLLGIEVVYGSRRDNDGEKGSNVRTLVTSRFNF